MALAATASRLIPEEWLCESCRLRPAVRVTVIDGASFQVCAGCVTAEAQS